jgi:heat shock protein HslJ
VQSGRIVTLVLMLISLSACSIFDREADGMWQFERGTVDGVVIEPAPGEPVTLEISSGAVTGHAGCNTYGIEADVYSGSFQLYPDREITGAECAPVVMDAEARYWAALQRVSIYAVDGDTLQLEGEDTYLTFTRDG